jgi:glycerol kinase
MRFIGALDQGTSSTRFIIFDESGSIVSKSQKEHSQILPQPGWVEHDAAEIWENTKSVISDAISQIDIDKLSAIGITNQRETTVVWDKNTGAPLHNAIVWQDTRTQKFLNSISEPNKKAITHKSGLTIAPYFSGSKMNWFIENVPAVRDAIADGSAIFGTIDSWLLWNLTEGIHKTDVTNASRTLLMNLETLDWDDELLAIFSIPKNALPKICSSSEIYGVTKNDGFIKGGLPISGILGDQQAAMVGQACFDRGESKTTYGTGNFALFNTGKEIVRSKTGLLTTVCYKFGDEEPSYALEGSVAVSGSAVQWLRDQLGIISNASEIEVLAKQVSDNGGVYFVPAFSGLFAPYWRSDARGVIVGLTRAVTKSHVARATLEAIAYQTREVLDAMSIDSGVPLAEVKVDGGITANELCMQIQSDIMGIDVIRPEVIETTALGAAYAAGLATGFYRDKDQIRLNWRENKRWRPDLNSKLANEGFKNWKRAVERSFDWV